MKRSKISAGRSSSWNGLAYLELRLWLLRRGGEYAHDPGLIHVCRQKTYIVTFLTSLPCRPRWLEVPICHDTAAFFTEARISAGLEPSVLKMPVAVDTTPSGVFQTRLRPVGGPSIRDS